MAAAAVGTSPRPSTAGRAGLASWTGPLRRSAWTVALVTALGAALGLLLVVHRDHRYAARASVVLDSSAGSTADRQTGEAQAVVDLVESGQVRGGVARVLDVPVARVRPISAAVVGDGSTVELRSSARNPGRAETIAATAVAVAVGLQDSQGSLVSPLPAFHAGTIDGSATATGPGWAQVALGWGAVAMALAVAGVYVVAYANGWAPETGGAPARRPMPAASGA
jgi:hypothetical protein